MGIKLLVDIHPLLRRRTGVGNYIFYLLREMVQDARVEDVVGVDGLRFWQRDELVPLLFPAEPGVAADTPTGGSNGLKQSLRRLPWLREARGLLQAARLRLEWSRYHDYVFWGGNYYLPPLRGLKSVVTVHDLSHLHYPEFHPADRVKFLQRRLPGIIGRANAVVAVSEATQQDIYANLGKDIKLPPVFVVSPACASLPPPPLAGEGTGIGGSAAKSVREKYQLPAQFILSVGTLEPRKNVARLLAAFQSLEPELQRNWPLLLAGDQGWLTGELAARLQQEANVRWLGFVPDEDMPGLYQAAGVFAYVSLFEGFGMPVLEAMGYGVPVLTSNLSSLPEAAGGAALLADPLSTSAIADSLRQLLQDRALRERLAAAGRKRAQQFDWKDSARRLLDICETLNS